jgi:hypothetical protein
MPSSPAETCNRQSYAFSIRVETYHVETKSALPLRLEHKEVHNAYYAQSAVCPTCALYGMTNA